MSRLVTYADLQPVTAGGVRAKDAAACLGWPRPVRRRVARRGVPVEPLAAGPAHHDHRITYRFSEPEESGIVEQLILALGKPSFPFGPDEIPTENVPQRQRHYKALVHFIADDPWSEFSERYHLQPRGCAPTNICLVQSAWWSSGAVNGPCGSNPLTLRTRYDSRRRSRLPSPLIFRAAAERRHGTT